MAGNKARKLATFVTFLALCGALACDASSRLTPAGLSLVEILKLPDPRERTELLLAYFDAADGADLPEIQVAYNAARPYLDPVSGTLLAQWWVQFDPVSAYNDGLAAAWLERTLWAGAVFREWARIAPEAALETAMAIPKESGQEWRRHISLALIRGWFDGDGEPEPLLDLILRLPLGRPQKESLDVLLVRMIEREQVDGAIAFVEQLPDGAGRHLKTDAFKRMAKVLTQHDPALGIAWVEKHGEGPYGKNLAVRVGRVWGRTAGQPALEWATQLPQDVSDRERVIVEAFRGWSGEQPAASQAWIEAQPLTRDLEGALKLSITRQARQDPRSAIARAEAIESPALRNELLGTAGRIWINLEPEAANAWIAGADLAPAVERTIRTPLPGQAAAGASARRLSRERAPERVGANAIDSEIDAPQ